MAGNVRCHCVIASLLIVLTGCDDSTDRSITDQAVDELRSNYEKLQESYDKLRERAPDDVVEWAKEDFESFGDWEYKVLVLDDPTKIETELNALGKERWEAFWVERHGQSLHVFLKRPTKSYLQAIPFGQ